MALKQKMRVVQRAGRTFHVYGQGADKRVVEPARAAPDESRTYGLDQESGERAGQKFDEVIRGGRVFHTYGSGADKQVEELDSAAKERRRRRRLSAAVQSAGQRYASSA